MIVKLSATNYELNDLARVLVNYVVANYAIYNILSNKPK